MPLADATNDYPVRLGSMLFTLIEPHAGHEREYNRWYERDHFYGGCLVGEWNFSGGRFVATRELKDLREPQAPEITDGDRDRGSFLSMYWIHAGHHDDWARWGGKTVHELHDAGRMFPHRDHVHTKLYTFDWALGRDEDPVPIELALDHRFPGLGVVIGEAAPDVAPDEVDRWYREEHLPDVLPGSAAAVVSRFSILPMPSDAPGVPTEEGSERRFLQLWFLDERPQECWQDALAGHSEVFAASGLGHIQLVAPFLPTVPGTDTYLDQL